MGYGVFGTGGDGTGISPAALGPAALCLWGKTEPYHPLYCHMIDAGNTALELLGTDTFKYVERAFSDATGCDPSRTKGWLSYVTAIHDIGKCHGAFQVKGPTEIVERIERSGLTCFPESGFRHEAAGASWLLDHFTSHIGWELRSARTVAEACRGHHGSFRIDDPPEEPAAVRACWEPVRSELNAFMRGLFAPWEWRPKFRNHSVAGLILSGLIVLSDWIASNTSLFEMSAGGFTPTEYFEASRGRARTAVSRLGMDAGAFWHGGQDFRAIWPGMSPRPIQVACEELCRGRGQPGLAIIEAPMGEGKTEAAFYVATQWSAELGLHGMYVALPTAATSNQMYGRFRGFLSAHDSVSAPAVRLVHGMAWLVDQDTPDSPPVLTESSGADRGQALEWFRPKKRSLLAANGVGTVDQALMSVLHVKHGFLRLFGLAGKVLIIDEVHAYDAYMTEIISLLLRWCHVLNIPVILLSATLPAERREALVRAYSGRAGPEKALAQGSAYPLLTVVPHDGSVHLQRVCGTAQRMSARLIRHEGALGDTQAIARIVAERARDGGCHCVIANTVSSAQAIYRTLKALCGDRVPLLLFHARYRAGRREEIELQTLAWFDTRSLKPVDDPERTTRPQAAILVATQVVEQSLDLDFDEMFSEIAPVDLLLQRAGRLHRHRRLERPTGPRPRLHIFLPDASAHPDFGSTEYVYKRYVLLQTLRAVKDRPELVLPGDIRPLVEGVYRRPDCHSCPTEDTDLMESWRDLERTRSDDAKKAEAYLIPPPDPLRFSLASNPCGTFDEDEGDAAGYFVAKTRLGDRTQSILALEGSLFGAELAGLRPPPRSTMKMLLRESVSIPRAWLRAIDPDQGYEAVSPAPDWLPGIGVLRLRGGVWRGAERQTGRRVVIHDDAELGLTSEEVN
jgi:CRISPR-associated endonuclease/helicase Cas3